MRAVARRWVHALMVSGLLVGCVSTSPPVERQPALVPLHDFFASRDSTWGFRVSPDGAHIAWLASHARRHTVHVRALDSDSARPIDTHSPRTIFSFQWASDSRRILYLQDQDGDENYHVYLAAIDRPDDRPVDLTPEPGSRAFVSRVIRSDPAHIVVGWNRRDRSVFDLYRVNLDTGEATLIAENPGDVTEWHTDWEGRPRARLRQASPETLSLETLREGVWVEVQRLDLEEFEVRVLGVTADDRGLWMLSGRGRDRRVLVRLDLATGIEAVVHDDGELDVEWVVLSERTRQPLALFTYPGHQVVRFFDPTLAAALAPLRAAGHTGLHLLGFDGEERLVTVQVFTEKGWESWLVDRLSGQRRRLAGSHIARFVDSLASMEPVTLTARDGLRLHGYLTRPPGYRAPGPLVLHVHGGHWIRDYWGYDRVVQFLANRGYAVLQINYRGSSGYGRRFRELAIGEYAGKMHDDLVDAARWAVTEGIADPRRIAIHGGSYGGYSALVGMTFTPDVFACGVAVVPISNLLSFYEKVPPYWKHTYVPRFHKYVGDPSQPEARRRLEDKSPLFRADRVQRPVLLIHGARDTRVNVRESEQMAAALRHYAEIEDFLARCLGGRTSGLLHRLGLGLVAPPPSR